MGRGGIVILCHIFGCSLWCAYSRPQGLQLVIFMFVLIPDFNSWMPCELGSHQLVFLLPHLRHLVLVDVSVVVWSSTTAVMNYSGQLCTHCPSRDDDKHPVLRPDISFPGTWRWVSQWREQEVNQSLSNIFLCRYDVLDRWNSVNSLTAFLPFAWDIEISQVSFSEYCKNCPSYIHFLELHTIITVNLF